MLLHLGYAAFFIPPSTRFDNTSGRWLFLSSANLTEYAFTINMELGVLVTGGHMPRQVQDHFDKMMTTGLLARLT